MFDLNRSATLIKGALVEPRPTWQAYYPESDNWQRTLTLITLPMVVAAALVTLLISLVFAGLSPFPMFGTGVGVMATLWTIIWALVSLALTAFIFSWLAGVFKGRHDFPKAFAALSLTAVPAYVGSVVMVVPLLGWLAFIALFVYSVVLFYQAIPEYLGVPEESRAAHFIAALVVTLLIFFILGMVFGVGMMQLLGGGPTQV